MRNTTQRPAPAAASRKRVKFRLPLAKSYSPRAGSW
jgi:hypothetical protein